MQIIDIHAHDGSFPHTEPHLYNYLGENMQDFNADLTKDNVSHCFITSTTALNDKGVNVGNNVTFSDADTDSRLRAYVYYNPNVPLASMVAVVEHYMKHPKFIGFKTRPSVHGVRFDEKAYEWLLHMAEHLNVPILAHSYYIDDAKHIVNAFKNRTAKVIMVHACNDRYVEACEMVKGMENVYVEPVTSTVYPNKIREIINIVGHERLMFGSDYGLLSRARVISEYDSANLSSKEYEAIFRTNAERVFKLNK